MAAGLSGHLHEHGGFVRARQLVKADWLAALVAGQPVPDAPAAGWRLLEVGFDGLAAFVQAHIPGAGYLDTRTIETGPLWNKVPDRVLRRVLLAQGIRHDTVVILYGHSTLAAARAAHLMLYAGVRDVRLLDGGWPAWLAAGHAAAAGRAELPVAAAHFGADFPGRPELLIGLRQAQARVRSRRGVLVSVRTWHEHTGRSSGYPYIAARGDIPGARWGRAGHGGDVQGMGEYQRADGTMRPPQEILAFWRHAGIHAGQPVAFYCGTGWRASLAFFYAWVMGWERISVYDGGWCEWSRHAPSVLRQPPGPRRPQRRLREGGTAVCISRGAQPVVEPWPVPQRARLHPPW